MKNNLADKKNLSEDLIEFDQKWGSLWKCIFALSIKEKKKTNHFFLICVELQWAHFLLAALKPYLTFVQKGTLIYWSSLILNMMISMLGSNSSVVEIAALPLLNILATTEDCEENQWVLNRFFLIVYFKSHQRVLLTESLCPKQCRKSNNRTKAKVFWYNVGIHRVG